MNNKPNIVFVLTDDQGYGDLGCTGNPIIQTPNIDKFHSESARLTNYHVGPTCAPTRAGLMTGHYANSTGVWHTIGGRSLLRREEWTMAQALKDNGYNTGMFGKWHLGDEYPYRPMDRGFDFSIIHGGGGISQTPDYWGNDYFDDTYFVNSKPQKFEGYCTDVFFDEALKYIEDNRDDQFFCYIATNAPHSPYNVDSKYSAKYMDKVEEDRARFYGMIENIDENFGILREKLDELGIADNTILIFMTDNGTSGGVTLDTQDYIIDGYNAGLRGLKNSEYDGGHRVPFFIKWQDGEIVHGNDVDDITGNIDILPTLLTLCGIDIPENRTFDGKSIVPLLEGADQDWPDRTIVTDSQRITYPAKWRKSAVMTNKWRLVNGNQLYDMDNDREQRRDLAEDYPDVVKMLRCEYEKWWDTVSVQFDVDIPIIIGENPTYFTSHDMRNEDSTSAWNQSLIRNGYPAHGYWEIEIEEEGRYQIDIRRWPKSENRLIKQGIDGDDIEFSRQFIQEKNYHFYTGGKALDIEKATIHLQGQNMSVDVAQDDAKSTFIMELKKGKTKLKAFFSNADNNALTAAYYIEIVKK